jgi:chromosome partitioning protein
MRKIAIVGFKGGIGKTTTCVTLGHGLARLGRRVLIIDTDTQANVALALGIEVDGMSLPDVLTRKTTAEACIVKARENLDLLPSHISLFKAQQRMVLEMGREELFDELFAALTDYDYQLLDCAPSVSLLTVNTLAYVDEVFIPVSMEILAFASVTQFMSYLKEINEALGRQADIRLIIPTMYDPRRKISKEVLVKLRTLAKSIRITEPIWIDTKISEAPGVGQTIFEYAPNSRAASDYKALIKVVETMPPLKNYNHHHATS